MKMYSLFLDEHAHQDPEIMRERNLWEASSGLLREKEAWVPTDLDDLVSLDETVQDFGLLPPEWCGPLTLTAGRDIVPARPSGITARNNRTTPKYLYK